MKLKNHFYMHRRAKKCNCMIIKQLQYIWPYVKMLFLIWYYYVWKLPSVPSAPKSVQTVYFFIRIYTFCDTHPSEPSVFTILSFKNTAFLGFQIFLPHSSWEIWSREKDVSYWDIFLSYRDIFLFHRDKFLSYRDIGLQIIHYLL